MRWTKARLLWEKDMRWLPEGSVPARFNSMPANRFLPAAVCQGDKSQAGSGGAARRPDE
ncbi:hypothetical protein ACHHV8_34290 [Paenibacillus sp. TAB 01]|uniref:hypothetical protein n=1 Tax=Paenibacillus sp. TAB 01 TaxID=3368988 RepID=UPI003752779B